MPPMEFIAAAAPMLPLMLATAAAESSTLEPKVAAACGDTEDMPPTVSPMLFMVYAERASGLMLPPFEVGLGLLGLLVGTAPMPLDGGPPSPPLPPPPPPPPAPLLDMLRGALVGGGSAYSFCMMSMVVWWGLPLRKLFNSCAVMLPAVLTRCVYQILQEILIILNAFKRRVH